VRKRPVPVAVTIAAEDLAAHRTFIASLGDSAIWRDYVSLD